MSLKHTNRFFKVMTLASQEARRSNHEYVGTEHLLIALVREGTGFAANILKRHDLFLATFRIEVELLVPPGPAGMVTMVHVPVNEAAKKLLESAEQEALALDHNYVGTEHLLLAVTGENGDKAKQVLINLKLNPQEIRREIFELLGEDTSYGTAEDRIATFDPNYFVPAHLISRSDFFDCQMAGRMALSGVL